jgi:GTP-binding protein
MADIPGIIEGAAEGAGLGHDFLRHIDRCRLLVHVIDVSGSEGRDPVEDFDAICAELRDYSVDLGDRPMIVAANKTDLLDPESDNLERLRRRVEEAGCELYEISAGTTQGTKQLMRIVAQKLSTLPPVTIYEPEYVELIEAPVDPNEFDIEHYGNTWLVTGRWLERLIENINFDDYESRNFFDTQLHKCGLFKRLEEMGIEDGDTVDIYDFVFDYQK